MKNIPVEHIPMQDAIFIIRCLIKRYNWVRIVFLSSGGSHRATIDEPTQPAQTIRMEYPPATGVHTIEIPQWQRPDAKGGSGRVHQSGTSNAHTHAPRPRPCPPAGSRENFTAADPPRGRLRTPSRLSQPKNGIHKRFTADEDSRSRDKSCWSAYFFVVM